MSGRPPSALPKAVARELQTIPGIGPAMARDLFALGLNSLAEVARADPFELYERLCRIAGVRHDPCVLYTFRCAVYFASHTEHEPELLKWWNWKDKP